MLEFNDLLTPAVVPTVAIVIALGVSSAVAVKAAVAKRNKNSMAITGIRLHLIRKHPRSIRVLNERIMSLKTLVDIMSEIDLVPMCEDKRINLAMVSEIYVCDSLSHKSFVHFIKTQPTDMILKGVNAKEALLLKLIEGVDKDRLSNNLLVQGFDMMDDGRFIDDKKTRVETMARGERWVRYGHYLNKLQL